MHRCLLVIMWFFSLINTFSAFSSQKEWPEHLRKQCYVRPTSSYSCQDSTLEEIELSIRRAEEEKINVVKQAVEKEWGQDGLAQFNQLSRQQVIEIFNKSVRDTFLSPGTPEPTITVIPNAHEKAVASYNAKLRAEIQSSYKAERAKQITAYDRLAKGSLLFSGGVLALYVGDKLNLFSHFYSTDSRYYQVGFIFGLASSYYSYRKKQAIASMPFRLSDPQIDELLKRFKATQEQTIKDVCHLQ